MIPFSKGKIVSVNIQEQSSVKKDKFSQKQFASLTAIPQTGLNYSSYRYHPFEKFFMQEVQIGAYRVPVQKPELQEVPGFNKPIGLLLIFPHHYFW